MAKRCHACGAVWEDKRSPGFREECLGCAAPLHVCANCRFYDAGAAEWCREPQARAAKPRDPEASNTCDYFLFGDRADADEAASRAKQAREGLAALFGEAPPEENRDDAPPDWKTFEKPKEPFDPFRSA